MNIDNIMKYIEGAKHIPGMPKDLLNRVDKNIVNQAMGMASKYSSDKKGFAQAIKDMGANASQICEKANGLINNPLLRFGASKFGIKTSFLDEVSGVLKGDFTNSVTPNNSTSKPQISSSISDRLSKLK